VEQVLQANAPRPMRPFEIRSAIQCDKGASIAFGSIRQALSQLEARKVWSRSTRRPGVTTSALALPI